MLPLAIRDIDYNWRVWLSVGLSISGLGIMHDLRLRRSSCDFVLAIGKWRFDSAEVINKGRRGGQLQEVL